jgi:hypothetical protein
MKATVDTWPLHAVGGRLYLGLSLRNIILALSECDVEPSIPLFPFYSAAG